MRPLAAPARLGRQQPRRRPGWRYLARQGLWAAVDVVFPPRCGGCERAGERLCADCRRAITPLADPLCNRCGYPLPAEGLACAYCQQHPLPATLDGIRSAAFFEGPLQHALHRLKYRRDIILADTLAVWLAEACQRHQLAPEAVVAVPLSPERLRERGYNQAGLLAGALADLLGARYAPHVLVRVRHTHSQVGLTLAQRRENVLGAFEARGRAVAGRAVVLVDDVCTTGATLMAGAAALRAAGAAQVWGLTLGRAR